MPFPRRGAESDFVFAQRPAGVPARVEIVEAAHLRPRTGADNFAACFAAFRTKVDDPVGGADHIEIVLDDYQRMTGVDQSTESAQQLGDVVEMKAGSGFVKQKQFSRYPRFPCHLHQMSCKLQPLRLAA